MIASIEYFNLKAFEIKQMFIEALKASNAS